jgi:hypothetical protein
MTFERQLVEDSFKPQLQKTAGNYWASYDGMWAVDSETTDCLYFAGCDVLDPTIQRYYILLTGNRKYKWSVEILETKYIPRGFLSTCLVAGSPDPDYFAVVQSANEPSIETQPYALATHALRVLLSQPTLNIHYLQDWRLLSSEKTRIESERRPPGYPESIKVNPGFKRYAKELAPLGGFLLLALIVLFLEITKNK